MLRSYVELHAVDVARRSSPQRLSVRDSHYLTRSPNIADQIAKYRVPIHADGRSKQVTFDVCALSDAAYVALSDDEASTVAFGELKATAEGRGADK